MPEIETMRCGFVWDSNRHDLKLHSGKWISILQLFRRFKFARIFFCIDVCLYRCLSSRLLWTGNDIDNAIENPNKSYLYSCLDFECAFRAPARAHMFQQMTRRWWFVSNSKMFWIEHIYLIKCIWFQKSKKKFGFSWIFGYKYGQQHSNQFTLQLILANV